MNHGVLPLSLPHLLPLRCRRRDLKKEDEEDDGSGLWGRGQYRPTVLIAPEAAAPLALGAWPVTFCPMNLEDHLGDILRKGRTMSGVALEDAAPAAGLTTAELSSLEDSGTLGRKPDFGALGARLGLNGVKLDSIAQGWLPAEKDLGIWRELRWLTTSGDGMSVNSYLAWDEVSREAALFDTGFDTGPILKIINENQLQLRHIFITHAHGDHVAELPRLREHFPKARLHSSSRNAPLAERNRPNDFIHLGSLRITNRDTPGHAEDGTTYIIGTWPEDAPHVAIVGDALFAGSMGRGNQSWGLARQKVREQILTLPPETLLCPGHGPLTTVAEEKAHNPFF
jgi:hydroxyacylglutathione hydrolase